jgi:hypothetical protein
MSTLRLISVSLLFVIIAFATIGGCGGGGDGDGGGEFAGETNCSDKVDNDGDGEVDCADIDCILDPACPECQEIVAILCDRADECGFVLVDECVADYVFNDLGFDCREFLAGAFTDECMEDMDNFDCDAFGNSGLPTFRVYDDLPDSCGDEFIVPELQVPPGACEDFFVAICDRVVECDIGTFDECLLELLFFFEEVAGIDCSNVFEGDTLDECIEDLDDFDCDLIGDAIVPDSCIGVLVGNGDVEGLISRAEISFASAERFALDNLAFNPLLTFDEPEFSPAGPINGKTVQGVTFSFTVDGAISTDAAVGLSTGPGITPLLTPPIIEGDAEGLLVLIFDPPVNSVSFDFSLGTSGFDDIPDGATIRIFDETDNLLGTASADAIVPQGFLFHEGTLGINSDGQKLNAIGKHDSLIKSQNHLNDISDFGADW